MLRRAAAKLAAVARGLDRVLVAPGSAHALALVRTGMAAVIALRLTAWPYRKLAGQPGALFRPPPFLSWLPTMPGGSTRRPSGRGRASRRGRRGRMEGQANLSGGVAHASCSRRLAGKLRQGSPQRRARAARGCAGDVRAGGRAARRPSGVGTVGLAGSVRIGGRRPRLLRLRCAEAAQHWPRIGSRATTCGGSFERAPPTEGRHTGHRGVHRRQGMAGTQRRRRRPRPRVERPPSAGVPPGSMPLRSEHGASAPGDVAHPRTRLLGVDPHGCRDRLALSDDRL